MKPEYIKLLSPAERAASMRMGALMKFAEYGVPQDKIDHVVKQAAINLSPTKLLLTVSLLGGIPLGVAGHLIDRKITEQKAKERELREKIKFYREAAGGLERGLAGMGAPA
jgi:hypothetical protein